MKLKDLVEAYTVKVQVNPLRAENPNHFKGAQIIVRVVTGKAGKCVWFPDTEAGYDEAIKEFKRLQQATSGWVKPTYFLSTDQAFDALKKGRTVYDAGLPLDVHEDIVSYYLTPPDSGPAVYTDKGSEHSILTLSSYAA